MGIALILISLAGLCLAIFGWLWLAGGALRPGWRGMAGKAALQLSGLCLLWGLLTERPLSGLYMALFPPLAVVDIAPLSDFSGFLMLVLVKAAPWALSALVLALLWRPLRPWAPGLGVAVLMVAGAIRGEDLSREVMCKAAASRGLQDVRRAGLIESLAGRNAEDAPAPHGLALTLDGTVYGWSYRAMDWQERPEGPLPGETLLPASCP